MLRPPLTPEQWTQARRLRESGATFAAIAREIGAAESTIAGRARLEGWPRPQGARRAPGAEARTLSTIEMRRGLARRFYRVMGLNLELMELQMKKRMKDARKRGGDIAAIDAEKGMRPMTSAMKSIEHVKELDPDFNRPADGGPAAIDPDAAASEADSFRRAIAERLEKLLPPS